MIHDGGGIRVGECDSSKGRGAQNTARCRIAACPEEKPGLWVQVGVPPAVQDDTGDVAPSVKSKPRKHVSELLPYLPLIGAERGREQLRSAALPLDLNRQAGMWQ